MSGRLLDKRLPDGSFPFEYRNAAATDVRLTWAKAREAQERNAKEAAEKVANIKRKK